ncbi:type II secretion system minor pseudopilin GspJ [Ferrimonas marina]|uniref:Type II secretion system protein J n=1 Tax=Ferrimonas marina TaxID=299255 RepID=A0A1M5Z8Q5_9GAMM|nr:type II secretion system minor pseudopilin GspJ [Ferrimonas marina]SHI20615.1 general secretion pathway protein J [Ferrimonas marina]
MSPIQTKRQGGFTLMEMLMAMAIFATLAIGTATILRQVIQSDEVGQSAQGDLKALQLAMNMLERDFTQMIPRAGRDSFGEEGTQLFEHGDNLINSDFQGVRFYRLGWLNPQGRLPRGSVQQVMYRVQEETLQRLYSLYPDPVEGEEPIQLDLLDGVIDLKFAFYIEDSWQTQPDGTAFPKAVAVELELERLGVIRRHFMLAEGYGVANPADGNDGSGSGSGNEDENGNGSGNGNSGSGSGTGVSGASSGEGEGSGSGDGGSEQ